MPKFVNTTRKTGSAESKQRPKQTRWENYLLHSVSAHSFIMITNTSTDNASNDTYSPTA